MDNDDTLENNQSDQEKKPPKEDIPLWLQGLEDLKEIEDTNPVEMSANAKDAWVKEIAEELDKASEHLLNDEENQLAQSQLPEWLHEASEEETTPLEQEPLSEDDKQETPTQVEINLEAEPQKEYQGFVELEESPPTTGQEMSDTTSPEETPDDEYIEIPLLDAEKSQEQETFQEIDGNDELPEWLQEMISEPVEATIEDTESGTAESKLDDLSALQEGSIEEDVSPVLENKVNEFPQNVLDTSELDVDEEILEKSSETTPEEETKPVIIEPVVDDSAEEKADEAAIEVTESIEQANTLEFAKYQFNQGNIEEAIEIIASLRNHPDHLQYLDEMEQTLVEEVSGDAKDHSDAWELLGDIMLQKNKPEEAYEAYKHAIHLLIK